MKIIYILSFLVFISCRSAVRSNNAEKKSHQQTNTFNNDLDLQINLKGVWFYYSSNRISNGQSFDWTLYNQPIKVTFRDNGKGLITKSGGFQYNFNWRIDLNQLIFEFPTQRDKKNFFANYPNYTFKIDTTSNQLTINPSDTDIFFNFGR